MPRLKGLYIFGSQDTMPAPAPSPSSGESTPSPGSSPASDVAAVWNSRSQKALAESLVEDPEAWYGRRGNQFARRISHDWASTLVACDGIIAFDAVLCTGPRHLNSSAWGSVNMDAIRAAASSPNTAVMPHYGVATHSLGGCALCGSAPEGWTAWGESVVTAKQDPYEARTCKSLSAEIGRFPLLAPPPMHSANLNVAMCPNGQLVKPRSFPIPAAAHPKAQFIPRCTDCLLDRYCRACHQWWCEDCFIGPYSSWENSASSSFPVSNPLPTPDGATSEPRQAVYKVQDGLCTDRDYCPQKSASRLHIGDGA
jgi:hypothetical protein